MALTDAPQSAGLVALADRIELWPIENLRPYERNPRTHSDAQFDQIAASMVEFAGPTRSWSMRTPGSSPAMAGSSRRGSLGWPRCR
jgi:hypothetical protein